jgi:hypothetical protein
MDSIRPLQIPAVFDVGFLRSTPQSRCVSRDGQNSLDDHAHWDSGPIESREQEVYVDVADR